MVKLTSHRDAVIGNGKSAKQGDLFTGKWEAERPKRGNGSHVRLKPLDGEKAIVPGMASYAAEGPSGAYCRDCAHFGAVAVQHALDEPEVRGAVCSIYAKHMGHPGPTTRHDIRFCAACKHFVAADESKRTFIIDRTGVMHRVKTLPADVRTWRPDAEPQDKPEDA